MNYTINSLVANKSRKEYFSFENGRAVINWLTRSWSSGTICLMSSAPNMPRTELPDRLCTWCKVLMRKRLVGGNQFIHYTCPKCIFQHTTRLGLKLQTPAR